MIRLVEKKQPELTTWLAEMWVHYREQLIAAGETPEGADKNIARNSEALFRDGVPLDGNYIFDLYDGDVVVGTLWLAKQSERDWYVYDIVVGEEHRGKGYGRLSMEAAQDFAKGHGGARLSLNVFGPNKVARGLYASLGYQELAIAMFKDLNS